MLASFANKDTKQSLHPDPSPGGYTRDVDFIGYQRAGLSYPVYAKHTRRRTTPARARRRSKKRRESRRGVSFEFRPGMHSDARRTHNYYYGGPIYFIRTATHT